MRRTADQTNGLGTREGAIGRSLRLFDQGGFADMLARLVAIPSSSQDPARAAELPRYLEEGIGPVLDRLGFRRAIHPNPSGGGPILIAERMEAGGPVVITYGHGDTVRGLEDQWSDGLDPWRLTDRGDRWYGRGSADNKGQHAINLAALEQVIAERGGTLGFSVRMIVETGEETGSRGLKELVHAQRDRLAADVLLASDGPRSAALLPTISTGTRGGFHFELRCDLRAGGVHSGNWGGITPDPAIILAHALASITDRHGRILVRDWVPAALPPAVREVLRGCELESSEAARIDPGWGEPGLTAAEKIYGWTSFIVLSLIAGRPENPVNAVAPTAVAHCQIRYTVDVDPAGFMPALRAHLDAAGFDAVTIVPLGSRFPARRSDPSGPWVGWAKASMERTLGKRVQVIPNSGGGLPNDTFMDELGVPLLWVPHSYNGCRQHGPDEHLLKAPAREGIAAMAGLWWDLGEAGVPDGDGGRDRD